MQATGGSSAHTYSAPDGNTYGVHIFTETGVFTVNSTSPTLPNSIGWLVVAGGGGGGCRGGAGGAGGVRSSVDQTGGGGSLE